MINALSLLTVAVALVVMIPSETLSQAAPIKLPADDSKASLKETLSWLKKRLPEFGSFSRTATIPNYPPNTEQVEIRPIDFASCDLQYELYYQSDAGVSPVITVNTIPLRQVDPSAMFIQDRADNSVGGFPVYCVVTGSGNLDVPILIRGQESAFRVGRALKHAAILFGAKVAPF